MPRPILEKSRPEVSVRDYGRDALVEIFRQRLSQHPNVAAAFLFGSSASDKTSFWSDCDLVVVAQTEDPFVKRPRLFDDLFDLGFALDLLVYTPAEFAKMQSDASPFWKNFRESCVRVI